MSIKGQQDVHLDLEIENEILRLRVKELERKMGSPKSHTGSIHQEDDYLLPDVKDVESGKLKPRMGVILSDSSKIVLLNNSRKPSKPLATGTLVKAATMTGHLKPEHNREFFMGLVEAPRKGRG
eukprot:3632597-Rhodomonas_salina.1